MSDSFLSACARRTADGLATTSARTADGLATTSARTADGLATTSAAAPVTGRSGRGRVRRHTRENMLTKDNLLAGTDESGVRIRIFTAQLTGKRAAKVFPGLAPGLSESKYAGETGFHTMEMRRPPARR